MSTERPTGASAIIAALKVQHRLSSDEGLAALLKVGKSTIASWRRRDIPPKMLAEIESTYGVSRDNADAILARADDLRSQILRMSFFAWIAAVARAFPKLSAAKLGEIIGECEAEIIWSLSSMADGSNYKGALGAATFLAHVGERSLQPEQVLERLTEHLGATGSTNGPVQ